MAQGVGYHTAFITWHTLMAYDASGNMTSDGTNTYIWDARNHLASISGTTAASFAYDTFGRRLAKTINGITTDFLYDGLNPVQELSGTSNPYQFTGRENDGTGLYFYRARYYDPPIGRFSSEDPIGFSGGDNFYVYALNNPVNWGDPLGLQVQVCQRPLNFKPAKEYPHTFLYSAQSGTGYGLGPKSGWDALTPLGSVPGQIEKDFPYGPDGKVKKDYSCNTVSTNSCVESCVNRKAIEQTKKPPKYKLGTYQCDTWADDILRQCKKECGQ